MLAALPQPPISLGIESPLISPTEILSREHAILDRLMIAIESLIAGLINNPEADVSHLNLAAITVKDFGAAHHMAFEERYLFPKLRDAGVLEHLIDTLGVQHDRAREILDQIITLTGEGKIGDPDWRNEVVGLCMGFVVMYRAHAAREETVLFPTFYEVVTENFVDNIGMRLRDEERSLAGGTGLGGLMDNLRRIEDAAGTAELQRFTP
jgi:hemerythrin-like domain-containing protein